MNILGIHALASAILVLAGLFIILTGKSGYRYLLGILFFMNGSGLLLVSFSFYFHGNVRGASQTFIIMLVLVLEAVTGITIILKNRYRNQGSGGDSASSAKG